MASSDFQKAGTPGTWHRYVYDRSAPVFRAYWGVRYLATVAGLLWDSIAEANRDAFAAPLINGPGPAYDALRPLGEEQSMPQYADETHEQYQSRIDHPWDTWSAAGDEDTIIEQLELSGRPGAQIFRWQYPDHWSRFVVFYPAGSHPVTGSNAEYGDGTIYGDGTNYGLAGITPQQLETYRGIIKHWKPARWVCPWIIWEISGATYGTGHTYGEAGLVYGGEQRRTQVQAITEPG